MHPVIDPGQCHDDWQRLFHKVSQPVQWRGALIYVLIMIYMQISYE
jgi:hypothetical protein